MSRKHEVNNAQRTRDRLFLGAVAAIVVACLLGGGSSRPDVLSLLYLRPVIIVAIGAMLYLRGSEIEWRAVHTPLVLLGLMALLMGIQLVPLPPELWAASPGHGRLARELASVGMAQEWRPLSLAPDYTFNSLVALLVPAAAIIAASGLRQYERTWIPFVLAGIGIFSALWGTLQLTTGIGYVYQYADDTLPIGLFTNRNHQAALLAICLPALRICALHPRTNSGQQLFQSVLCAGTGLYLILSIILTGSRSGLLMGIIGLIAAAAIGWGSTNGRDEAADVRRATTTRRKQRNLRLAIVAGITALVVGLGAVTYLSGRGASFNRLQQFNTIADDQRITYAPITLQLTRDFFPTGIGFGAFDRVYRMNEPDWALHQSYFNHAHNDLIELAMTGGLVALLLLAALLLWVAYAAITARRAALAIPPAATHASRFAIAAIIILLLGSLSDYPLRTPVLAMIMGFAGALLAIGVDIARGAKEPVIHL